MRKMRKMINILAGRRVLGVKVILPSIIRPKAAPPAAKRGRMNTIGEILDRMRATGEF
jgi:hypothetical protein